MHFLRLSSTHTQSATTLALFLTALYPLWFILYNSPRIPSRSFAFPRIPPHSPAALSTTTEMPSLATTISTMISTKGSPTRTALLRPVAPSSDVSQR